LPAARQAHVRPPLRHSLWSTAHAPGPMHAREAVMQGGRPQGLVQGRAWATKAGRLSAELQARSTPWARS